jgi:hypothetical protein
LIDFLDRSQCRLEGFIFSPCVCNVLEDILQRNHHSLLRLYVVDPVISHPILHFIARGDYTAHFLRDGHFYVNVEDFDDLLIMLESMWSREAHVTTGEGSPVWKTNIHIQGLDDTNMERMREQFSESMAKFPINGEISLLPYDSDY